MRDHAPRSDFFQLAPPRPRAVHQSHGERSNPRFDASRERREFPVWPARTIAGKFIERCCRLGDCRVGVGQKLGGRRDIESASRKGNELTHRD
jgi:hypothetical protein